MGYLKNQYNSFMKEFYWNGNLSKFEIYAKNIKDAQFALDWHKNHHRKVSEVVYFGILDKIKK